MINQFVISTTIRTLLISCFVFITSSLSAQTPTVSSFTPITGDVGTSVTITGGGFNASGPNDVYFGTVKVTVNANASGTSITTNVPLGAVSVTPITVRNNATGLQASSLSSTTPFFTVTNTPVVLLNYGKRDFAVGDRTEFVVIGDFNNDSNPDFATANGNDDDVSIRLGDGSGGFTSVTDVAVGDSPRSIAVDDFNGDGNADLAVTNLNDNSVVIRLGDGTGDFSGTTTIAAVGNFLEELASGDFNGDGFSDLAVASANNHVAVLLGDGSGDFGTPTNFSAIGSPTDVAVGDFNGDGNADLAVTKSTLDNVTILTGDGSGDFSGSTTIAVGDNPSALALGDFNEDGELDLAVTNFNDHTVSIRFGDGTGSFSGTTDIAIGDGALPHPTGIIVGDFNGDGHSDFATSETNHSGLSVALGDGSGAFSTPTSYAVGNTSTAIATGDFNLDGKADIAVSNFADDDVSIMLWEAFPVFTASTSATNFTESGVGNVFDFDANDGDGGSTDAVTYSVLGTDASAFNISATGVLAFVSPPDFEVPSDNGLDNIYDVTVRANNGTNDTDITVAVTVDNGLDPFVTTWLATADAQITIPTFSGDTYNYIVYWENEADVSDNGFLTAQTDAAVLTGLTDGASYRVEIMGTFPRIYFNNGAESTKIQTVEQWGDIAWGSFMTSAFYGCSALSIPASDAPDLSSVIGMTSFFRGASVFNNDISHWDMSNVNFIGGMFEDASAFNNGGQPLTWGSGMANVVNMGNLFTRALAFNQDLTGWDVSSVTSMNAMFSNASAFNNGGVILNWGSNTAIVTNMDNMFANALAFNQDISDWDVSEVTTMNAMFVGASAFNNGGVALDWINTAKVTLMSFMFGNATNFNQDISSWDVSEVTDMQRMFAGASNFNQDISTWDVSKVERMIEMFGFALLFNNGGMPLTWSTNTGTGNVTDMSFMFAGASSFNQDISTWDVSSVTNMYRMFRNAPAFDQNLGDWDISAVVSVSTLDGMNGMLDNSGLSTANYDATLIGWATLDGGETIIPSNITLDAIGLTYCMSDAERTALQNPGTTNWTINDSGEDCTTAFIVINTLDNGIGSLRWAIENANTRTSKETVSFNIPGAGPWQIDLQSTITIDNPNDVGMEIDGLTQSTSTFGGDMITLDGSGFSGSGITVNEPDVEIYGLIVTNFTDGIELSTASNGTIGAANRGNVISGNVDSGLLLLNADNALIQGNRIGTVGDGLTGNGNGDHGIQAQNSANIQIGGNRLIGEGNVISSNGSGNHYGIQLTSNCNAAKIYGNLIGTDANGNNSLGNRGGIFAGTGCDNLEIGDAGTGEGNVISGCTSEQAIFVSATPANDDLVIENNLIGLNAAGTTPIPNIMASITLVSSGVVPVTGNIIRGNTIAASGNVHLDIIGFPQTNLIIEDNQLGTDINGNGGASFGGNNDGISFNNVAGTDNSTNRVQIVDNVIVDSNGLGIDLDISNALIQRNFIGVEADGVTAGANNESGILIAGGNNNLEIGGVGNENVFAYNTADGITFQGLSQVTSGTVVGANRYFCNDGDAIDFTNFPTVTAPVITSITSGGVAGTSSASDGSTIDVYQIDASCTDNQGATHIGQTTVSSNSWNYTSAIDDSQTYVATVSDVTNGISEFSTSAQSITFYSTGASVVFDNTAVWNSERDGSGTAPLASDFTSGLSNFVIESGNNLTSPVGAVNLNGFTIESGGSLRLGSPAFSIGGQTTIDGTLDFGTAANSELNPVSFLGPLTIGSTGEFERAIGGSQNFFVYFHDDIVNEGVFDLTLHTQWRIASPLTITNNSSSVMTFSEFSAGTGQLMADITLGDGTGNVLLGGTGGVTISDGVTITNRIGEGDFMAGRELQLNRIQDTNNVTFVNHGVVRYQANTALPVGVTIDLSNENLFIYNSSSGTIPVFDTPHYHLEFQGGASYELQNNLQVNGNLSIEGSSLEANGSNISLEGNWTNNTGSSGFVPAGGMLTFSGTGSSAQELTGETLFDNLVINNTGASGTVDFDSRVTVFGILTLTEGILAIDNELHIEVGGSISVASPDATRMIQVDAGGIVRKYTNSLVQLFYPIGTAGEYSPITLDLFSGTSLDGADGSRFVDVMPVALEEPNVLNSGVSLTRYWTIASTNLSSVNASLVSSYTDSDIQGIELNYVPASFSGSWSTASDVNVDKLNNRISFFFTNASNLDGNYTAGESEAFLPVPEIAVYEGVGTGGTEITDAQPGVVDLGEITQGSDLFFDVTIENTGVSDLTVSSITSSATEYSFVAIPSSVGSGLFSTFTLQLNGSTAGVFPSTITINSDDTDEAVFTFPVTGEILAPEPEITVWVGAITPGSEIIDDQPTDVDVGNAVIGNDITVPFFIENTGGSALTISSITSDAAEFTIVGAPTSVVAGGSESFDIVLDGSAVGDFSATISIANDDSDENPFTFPVIGQITEPEIEVYFGSDNSGTLLANGQATAVDIGTSNLGNDLSETFAIENLGSSILAVSSITSSDPNFTISSAPLTVSEGATEIFFIDLDASVAGPFTSTITIVNDDLDENPFTFEVSGTIVESLDIVFYDGGVPLLSGDEIDFGETKVDEPLTRTFTIENPSSVQSLTITNLSLDNAEFSMVGAPSSINPGESADFNVVLAASSKGVFNGTLTIESDFEPFSILVSGEVAPRNKSIHVFNVVTPNGDGVHDFLRIQRITEHPNNQVYIFNRTGKLLYEASGYNNEDIRFEGEGSDGKILIAGTYYYVIDLDGAEREAGFFQIITN